MKINLLKTKIIVFRNGGFLRENERWHFEGKQIEVVSAYNYMGLMVTPKLIWTAAKTKLASLANRAIISMLKMQRFVGYFDHIEYFKLFDTMINLFYVMLLKYGDINIPMLLKMFTTIL